MDALWKLRELLDMDEVDWTIGMTDEDWDALAYEEIHGLPYDEDYIED